MDEEDGGALAGSCGSVNIGGECFGPVGGGEDDVLFEVIFHFGGFHRWAVGEGAGSSGEAAWEKGGEARERELKCFF